MCVLSAKKQNECINIWLQLSEKEIQRRFFQQNIFTGHKRQRTQHTEMCGMPLSFSSFPCVSGSSTANVPARDFQKPHSCIWEVSLYLNGVLVSTEEKSRSLERKCKGKQSIQLVYVNTVSFTLHAFICLQKIVQSTNLIKRQAYCQEPSSAQRKTKGNP